MSFASATNWRATLRVRPPSKATWASRWRSSQLPHTNPAPDPHQRRQPAADRKVTNPPSALVMNSSGCKPAERATRPRPSRYDLDLEPVDSIDQHDDHANETQVQPHPHGVRSHRGPPGSGCRNHRFQRGLVPVRETLAPRLRSSSTNTVSVPTDLRHTRGFLPSMTGHWSVPQRRPDRMVDSMLSVHTSAA